MKTWFLIIIIATTMSCSTDKGTKSSVTESKDSTHSSTENTLVIGEQIAEDTTQQGGNPDVVPEDDCIFNNDYLGLTTEWLAEVGKANFVWQKDLEQASIPFGQDTIYIRKGGCEHFILFVELRLNNDKHTIADSTFWISKALMLATEFHLTQYEKVLKEKKMKRIENNENIVWYEIEDDNTEDNLYYTGVEINCEKKTKVISLSQYYN